MANQTRYVSPTGNQPAGYDAYYTTVNSAVAAVLSGDEVVLEMSTAHVWETGVVTRSGAQLFVIRNELNNDDYDACVVTVADNAQFVYSNSTANRSHAVFRGVTFAGPEGDYAEYDAGTVTGFLKMSSQCGANIIFKNVAFRRFKWVSEGGTGVRALTMAIAPTINAYHRTKLVVQDCVFTDMRSVGAITEDWPRVLLVRDCDAVFERCRFEDFGSTDRTSGCDVRTDSNEQTDFNVTSIINWDESPRISADVNLGPNGKPLKASATFSTGAVTDGVMSLSIIAMRLPPAASTAA